MVANSKKIDPQPGQLLWSGKVQGHAWQVICIEVVYPEPSEEPDENGICTDSNPFWKLRFQKDDGEFFETSWSPDIRILYGTLAGWTKETIGRLKTVLDQHGWQKPDEA